MDKVPGVSGPVPVILLKTPSQPLESDSYLHHFSSSTTDDSPSSLRGLTFQPEFIPVLKHHADTAPVLSWIADPLAGVPSNPSLTPLPASHLTQSSSTSQLHDSSSSPSSPSAPYGGLIFTSQRAVEAFSAALSECPTLSHVRDLAIPVFVVGPATARAVGTVVREHLPRCRVLGDGTGNGEELAKYILAKYEREGENGQILEDKVGGDDRTSEQPTMTTTTTRSRDDPRPRRRPLLFFVGEQRRDVIPRTLMDAALPAAEQIQVDERIVYQTGVEEGFEGAFAASLNRWGAQSKSTSAAPIPEAFSSPSSSPPSSSSSQPAWVVVFSPSGCDTMLRVLGWDVLAQKFNDGGYGARGAVRVATIGPTTANFLRDQFGFRPHVVARRPSPEQLRRGIEEFLASEGGGSGGDDNLT